MSSIAVAAADLQLAFDAFRARQVEGDGLVPVEHKSELRKRVLSLSEELNQYLARDYGINPSKPDGYSNWLISHRPFHWFLEFHGIMKDGGFDVILGNPPYVELNALREYRPKGYKCESCGNTYALFIERCLSLQVGPGREGFIVPVSSISIRSIN